MQWASASATTFSQVPGKTVLRTAMIRRLWFGEAIKERFPDKPCAVVPHSYCR